MLVLTTAGLFPDDRIHCSARTIHVVQPEPALFKTFADQIVAPSATPYVEAPTVPAQWLPCPCWSAAHVVLDGEHTVRVPGYVPEAATSTPAKARPPNSL
mmetsp:Transcript_54503/g.152111  ORF Transcript_54503/g.152111 Transcript_54503/m.152111 type:complete len:100 (-) Transcript_54503:22-321(-)